MIKCTEKKRLLAEYQRAAEHLEACLRALQHKRETSPLEAFERPQPPIEQARQQSARALLALEAYLGMGRC